MKCHRAGSSNRLAGAYGTEQWLIKFSHPATSGMVERFTRAHDLEQTIERYAWLHYHHTNRKA